MYIILDERMQKRKEKSTLKNDISKQKKKLEDE